MQSDLVASKDSCFFECIIGSLPSHFFSSTSLLVMRIVSYGRRKEGGRGKENRKKSKRERDCRRNRKGGMERREEVVASSNHREHRCQQVHKGKLQVFGARTYLLPEGGVSSWDCFLKFYIFIWREKNIFLYICNWVLIKHRALNQWLPGFSRFPELHVRYLMHVFFFFLMFLYSLSIFLYKFKFHKWQKNPANIFLLGETPGFTKPTLQYYPVCTELSVALEECILSSKC